MFQQLGASAWKEMVYGFVGFRDPVQRRGTDRQRKPQCLFGSFQKKRVKANLNHGAPWGGAKRL